jgi:hypothetical protein
MSDIVERLRADAKIHSIVRATLEDAADEIDRLREHQAQHEECVRDQQDQIERLRGALMTVNGYMHRWQIDDEDVSQEIYAAIEIARAALTKDKP